MTKVNPKKLLNSKWTSTSPKQKEKHFMVDEVEYDEDDHVIHCLLVAVINRKQYEIDWRSLNDTKAWLVGWV
jgi:tryptophan-rich hypothetical protein